MWPEPLLIRHGTAGPRPPGRPDAERPLSGRGQAQARALADRLPGAGSGATCPLPPAGVLGLARRAPDDRGWALVLAADWRTLAVLLAGPPPE